MLVIRDASVVNQKLSEEHICQQAIQIVNNEGLEALSMRKLAAALNVKAASLYNHIRNKSDLFDKMQGYLYNQMKPLKHTKNWKSHLTKLAVHTRDGLLQNPNMLTLFATRPTLSIQALQQAEQTIGILINAGFKPSNCLMIYRNLNVFIMGHTLSEIDLNLAKANQDPPSIRSMNIDQFPLLNKASQFKSNTNQDQGFKKGLQHVLNGLELSLTHHNCRDDP